MAVKKVTFHRGQESKYWSNKATRVYITDFEDGIYFAEDTSQLLLNGKSYGSSIASVQVIKGMNGSNPIEVTTGESGNYLYLTYKDGTAPSVLLIRPALATPDASGLLSNTDFHKLALIKYTTDEDGTDHLDITEANIKYNSKIEMDDLEVADTYYGDIKKGSTVKDWGRGQYTYDEMFDAILFPTVNPVRQTQPSLSISFSGVATTQEVNAANTMTGVAKLNITKNKGAIYRNGEKISDLGGDWSNQSLYVNNTIKTPDTSVALGSTTYYITESLSQGPMPKTNKGVDYPSIRWPQSSDSNPVKSNTLTVNGVYPYYASINTPGTNVCIAANKLTLTTATQLTVACVAETAGNKHSFALPSTYSVTNVQFLDTLSNTYKDFTGGWSTMFTTGVSTNIAVNGPTVAYKVYTRKDDGIVGATTYKIFFSK